MLLLLPRCHKKRKGGRRRKTLVIRRQGGLNEPENASVKMEVKKRVS